MTIWHSVRRWWWTHVWSGFYTEKQLGARCSDCGKTLTTEEREYYACTCERCEGIWHARMRAE